MGMGYCEGQRAEGKSLKIIIPHTPVVNISIKYCPRCRDWYPGTEEYFFINRSNRDGLATQCKECNMFARNKRKRDATIRKKAGKL